ncbi:MAG: leucine-rich repeat domain-containing protein [Ruminococcaceae bacterium]|nr:leucine-rich repeat domain-containing protein [Oscillospiraceae bacterium]
MKKILSLVLVCVMMLALVCVVSFANAAQIGESSTSWELVDGVLTVTGTGAMPDYRNVEDTRPWLSELSTITKVVVKSGVTHVGSSSFTGATGITEVVLEEGVETVGMDAFSYCGTIDKVSFPSTLTSLSQGVFYSSSIKEISYPLTYAEFKANVDVAVYNDAVDAADWGEEVATSGTLTATMSWSFADGTLTISGTGAMPNWGANATPWVALNAQITKVELSEGITTIGSNAFAHTKIVEIVIPEGVTAINGDAFAYVSTLKTVHIPSTLQTMGQGTVYGSNNISTVYYYGESKTAFEDISSKASYNTNYTKDGVNFIIAKTDVEIQVIPYASGMENWSNQTQILICPKLSDGTKVGDLYTQKDLVWTITLTDINGVSKTVNLKQSSQYDGGTWGILRFQPCVEAESNRFVPYVNNAYTVEVSVKYGNTTYHGVSAVGAYTMGVSPIVNGVVDDSYVLNNIELDVYPAFGGWENWAGSPNKGDAAAVTQLLVGARAKNGAQLSKLFSSDNTWTIKLTWVDNKVVKTKTIQLNPASYVSAYNLLRFETVLGTGANQFIPEKAQAYTVEVSATIDGVTYSGTSAQYAFSVPMYPIVNGVEDTDYEYVEIPDYFVAMVGKYYFENLQEAIWYAESEAVVNGKINKDDVNTVVVYAEGTHSIFTNTVVAVVAAGDNINFTPYNGRKLLEKEVEVDGDTYTAYVYAHKDYAVAAVGEDVYTSVGAAVAAAEATTIEGVKNNPVVIFQEGNVTVNTDKMVAVVPYDDYSTSIVYDGNKYVAVEETVEYEGDTYTAYAIINTETFAQAMVGDTFYATVEEAIAAAEASTIEGVKNNPVIVLKSGTVEIDTAKAVAVVAYDEGRTTFVFDEDKYFTYEVEVEYEGDTRTAYAALNTETFAQAMVGDTFYATVEEAIAAAEASTIEGVKNNPVIVLKSGVVAINTTKAVAVVALDEGRTTFVFDENKYFTYEVEVEYEGDTRTAYAVLNAVDFCQAIVGDTMYADIADAIAAAKGTFTPVIVLKPGVVNVNVDSFVLLGALDSTVTTINPNGNLSYETEVEYEGDTYTAYAVYNHNYIFANVADKITAAIPQANATYVDGALNIALSTTDLTTLVGTDVFEEIVAELAPLFILSEDASICGVTLYENDQLIVSNVFKAFNALGLDLEAIANLGTKELTSFDIAITGATTNVVVPVSITLDITDAQFESLKTNAAKADKYVDYTISDNGEIVLVVDARPVVDIVMEKELVNGKTIKEIREFINGTSLKELADKLEGYGLTGAKGEAVKVFCKLIDKIATTKYAANLDSTLAAFDSNNDGVYVVNKTFTVSFGEKVNQIVDQFKEKNPEIADYIEIENIVDVDSLTISVDATVTVFDKYTVTFVDVNGNEIYTETLLEGEIPSYVGVLPEKEATAEYVYVFFGWTDGETTFDGELAELTKNVTYKPVFEEVAVDGVDEDLIFAFGSVTFQDSFAINMGVNKTVLEGYTSWYVVATLADGSEETLYGTENGSYIKFTLNSISAKEVSDVTSFVIYAEKEVNGVVVTAHGNAKEYCIKQYAMNKICCENASDELKTLCVDTLVYAAYAQIKFGYNTANLATKDLTADDFALGTQGAPVLENAFSYENTETELVHFHQATLVYESNIAIKFYLNLKEYAPEDVYVKVVYDDGASELVISGEELVANGNFYTFEFSEYSAAELRREVVATVYDANTDAVVSGPLTYGAEVYAYRQVAAGKDVDLVNAMMNYAISAEAVFNA